MNRAKTLSKTRVQVRKRKNAEAIPETGPFPAGKNLTSVLCVLLVAATIALYSPVIGHSFIVLDDHDYVTANSHVQHGLAWSTLKWAFTTTAAANWHPLTWLSHALDCQLFALSPMGHHLDSVLLHALNALLLFLLLRWVTNRIWASLLVVALFALHPINVESVAWVAERKNVLSTLFFLLAIAAYVRYAQKPGWRRYLLASALFVAGLMAKPMVITLPFVLLLLDYWPLGRTPGSPPSVVPVPQLPVSRLLLEKIPLLLLSAASALITLKAQRTGHAMRTLQQLPLSLRIENALAAYGLYLWKMLWPTRLSFYPHSATALPAWQWILSVLILVGVTILVVSFRRKRYLPVGWFWFLGILVPVLGLVQVGEADMADRYAYLPLIGIFVMIAWGLDEWAKASQVRPVWRLVPALCALAALSFVTTRQISYWESDYDLWSHALAVTENESPFAHNFLGAALLDPHSLTQRDLENLGSDENRFDEAHRNFEVALKIYRQLAQQNPNRYLSYVAGSLNNLGTVDRYQNHTDDARQHFEGALETYRKLAQQNMELYQPDIATTLNNLGNLDLAQKRTDEARQHYEEASAIYRKLAQGNSKYAADVARVEASLQELEKKLSAPIG